MSILCVLYRGYKDKDEIALFCEKIKSTLDSVLGVERIGGIGVVEIDKDNEIQCGSDS